MSITLRRTRGFILLSAVFVRELAKSVFEVFLTVLAPSRCPQSAIVAVPLDIQSEFGIAVLANMITLTPGTTSLHVSEDRKTLFVHVMNLSDDSVEQMKAGFERLVKEVWP